CTGTSIPFKDAIRGVIFSQQYTEYDVGTACGVMDGLYNLVLMLYDLSAGASKAAVHTPLTKLWFIDLAIESHKAGQFWKGFDIKWTKDKIYWFGGLVNFLDAVSKLNTAVIVKNVLTMLDEFWGNISGVNGAALVGYEAGKIVFEIVIAALTGGFAEAKYIANFSKKGLNKLITYLSKPNAPDVGGLFDDAIKGTKGISGALRDTRNLLLVAKCFVAGTVVMLAPGEMSAIEELELGTSVVTQKISESENIVANSESGLSDLVSQEQRRVDETSTQTTWCQLELELAEDGFLTKIALLRPLWWVRERACFDVGDTIHLAIREQNIEGNAHLSRISEIAFSEVVQKKNLTAGHDYQIITGKFERTSSNVRRLIFDNGEELLITGEHPMYSKSASGWKNAEDIVPGELIQNYGGTAILKSTVKLDTTATVYNLEVREDHTFHVGASGILVHNAYQISLAKIDDLRAALKKDPSIIPDRAMSEAMRDLLLDVVVYKKFKSDFGGSGFIDNISFERLEAWKGLIDRPEWVRLNTDLLGKIAGESDDYIARVNLLYKNFSLGGPFPDLRHGINFNKYGFPDFSDFHPPISKKKYFSEELFGNGQNTPDYSDAANWFVANNPNATLANGGKGIVVDGQYYAMHHMEDGKTIMPVLGAKHSEVGHTGGGSIIAKELKGLFEIP
ncbi:MAG: hypothetical protein DRI69_07045, partial [Bacteroidetes bacterium]